MPMAWTKRDATAMFQRMVEERHHDMGRTIERLRAARGWTQADLAHNAGVSIGTISRLENGRHEGRAGTVRAVATALGVQVQELLPGAEPVDGDMSQLDRIEAMLKQLVEIAAAQGIAASAGQIAEAVGEQPAPKKPRRRAA